MKVEEIQSEATTKYRELSRLSIALEARIETALTATPSTDIDELKTLFRRKGALDAIAEQLEEIILRSIDNNGELQNRWFALVERMHSVDGTE